MGKNDHQLVLLLVKLLMLREIAEKYCWKYQARAVLLKLGCANESPRNCIKIQSNSVCLRLLMKVKEESEKVGLKLNI